MDSKEDFINLFVVTFLATYAATNYCEWCVNNQHDRFDNLPVEDAKDIAEKAWEKWKQFH